MCPPHPALHPCEGSQENWTHPLPTAQMWLPDGQMFSGRSWGPPSSQNPLFSTLFHGAVREAFVISTGRATCRQRRPKSPCWASSLLLRLYTCPWPHLRTCLPYLLIPLSMLVCPVSFVKPNPSSLRLQELASCLRVTSGLRLPH